MADLSHFDETGASRMVDVSGKVDTIRIAVATGLVRMLPETLRLILNQKLAKGNVLEVARLAGIMGAKQTSQLIPLCHPLPISGMKLDLVAEGDDAIRITAEVKVTGKTGVEMEALTAVATAALTIYDMCKAIDRGIRITEIGLIKKTGGKSGVYLRPDFSPGKKQIKRWE